MGLIGGADKCLKGIELRIKYIVLNWVKLGQDRVK